MIATGREVKNLLIVEDDEATRGALSLILEAEGYQVSSAANGQEAMEQLAENELPCLILLDLMMPVMDGWEFRNRQRKDPELRAIPVIILSADGNVRQKAASLGATDYLQKPIDFDSLLAKIERYC